MANRAIKYRIYPNQEQRTRFAQTFGCCRKVWNLMLADQQAHYQETGTILHTTPAQYKDTYPYLREVDSLALANVQLNLRKANKAAYKDGISNPPKFKSKHRSKASYTTNCQYPTNSKPTIRVTDTGIHLPVIGDVKAVIHRYAKEGWTLKSATVSQDSAGNYYCSVLYEYETVVNQCPVNKSIGFDYKSDGLYMDSDGHCADMPKYFRQSQKKIAKAQKALSRKQGSKKGEPKSANWKKAQHRVNQIYRHTANQRQDYLHKLSTEIANQYDVVCIEDLNMKAMSNKGFGNGKATMDNGWGMFTQFLEYKLSERGKSLVRIDRWYPSSQNCHICGHRQKMPVTKRTYVCPSCGMVMDRDYNAAINILHKGLRMLQSA